MFLTFATLTVLVASYFWIYYGIYYLNHKHLNYLDRPQLNDFISAVVFWALQCVAVVRNLFKSFTSRYSCSLLLILQLLVLWWMWVTIPWKMPCCCLCCCCCCCSAQWRLQRRGMKLHGLSSPSVRITSHALGSAASSQTTGKSPLLGTPPLLQYKRLWLCALCVCRGVLAACGCNV